MGGNQHNLLLDRNIWQAVFDSVEDVAIILTKDFDIEAINRKGQEIFGTGGNVLHKKCFQVICQKGSPTENCPLACHLKNTEPLENQVIQTNGRFFKVNTTAIRDEGGNPQKFVDILHDITEHVMAEKHLKLQNEEYAALNEEYLATNEELKERNEEYAALNEEYYSTIEELREKNETITEQEERFRGLFNQSAIGVFVHDLDGNILEMNKKCLDLFGIRIDQVKKSNILSLHPERASEKAKGREALHLLKEKGKVCLVAPLLRNNGTEFVAEIASNVFYF
ncbi:MAG: PAS domain S-box protein [Bacteroidales bacterium]|nr:PAS domain S-box protein [Bacteroidales bacterium]